MDGQESPIPRRARALGVAVVAVGWLVVPGCEGPSRTTSGGTANDAVPVVVYLIDTLRADRVGSYGYRPGTTPAVDVLAAESVVFEHAYAPAPWTLPSITSLMTSTFACEHGVVVDGQQLDAGMAPLAERLRAARYATASFYANPYAGPMSGLHRGYDTAEMRRRIDAAAIDEWLGGHAGNPFFLYVHTTEPHDPWLAPRRLVERVERSANAYKRRYAQLAGLYRSAGRVDFVHGRPRGTTDVADLQRAVLDDLNALVSPVNVLYDAAVLEADGHLAGVIAALRRHGVWDRTLFVLLADHGEEMGDHDGWLHGQSVYEEVVRVPLIVKFPDSADAGRRVPDPVSLVDVAPTILDVLGEPALAAGFRGSSLLPLVRGGARPGDDAASVVSLRIDRKKYFWPVHEKRGDVNVAVRDGTWKAICNVDRQTTELYDLGDDPGERRSVASLHAEIAGRLTAHAREWLAACERRSQGSPDRPAPPISPEAQERLRQLGYVE